MGGLFLGILLYSLYYKFADGAAHLNDNLGVLFVGGLIFLLLFFGIRRILNS